MELALEEAAKCTPTPSAFCVGAVLVSPSANTVISTGYSRELPGNTHAEQCCLDKVLALHLQNDAAVEAGPLLHGADIYTTMEPCSVRLSGNKPCTERLLAIGIGRVFLGTMEPDEFVNCEGTRLLKEQGVQVISVPGFAERCLAAARRGR